MADRRPRHATSATESPKAVTKRARMRIGARVWLRRTVVVVVVGAAPEPESVRLCVVDTSCGGALSSSAAVTTRAAEQAMKP
jgi:hypothetical protein